MLDKAWNKYKNFPVQIRASLWFLICSFLQKGISLITTPIFTRLLSTSEYGKYSVFDSWLKIITIFVSLHLYSGVYTQGLVKFSEDRKRFSSSIQGLTISLTLIWTIIYLAFHNYWNSLFSLTTVQMLAMLVMIWSTSAFNLWAGEQRVEYKYRNLVIATLIVSIAKPTVGIVFVKLATDKVTARILGIAIVELVGYIGFFIVQMKRGKQFYHAKYWKHAIVFNLPLIPHYLSQQVLNSSDRIMIKNLVGESEAGIYSLAYSISQIMILFNTALMQTISPWMYKKIKAKKNKDIASIAYISLSIIAVVNLTLILFAPEAVAIFAPKEYYEAIYVIPPVAMSVFFMYSYDLFAKFAFYYEKTRVIMMASVTGALLNLILNYIFIGMYGYIAAGYTTLVCYMVYSVIHYMFMCKVCRECCEGDYPYETRKILRITIPFLIAGFAFLTTYQLPVVRYGIVVAAFIPVVIFRKEIMTTVKRIMSLKKKAKS